MTSYTPGPWKYSFESVDKAWAIVTDKSGSIVANVNTESGPDLGLCPRIMPAQSNATLISAAPDLLDALIGIARACNGRLGQNPYTHPAYKAACQAVAKAKGMPDIEWMNAIPIKA